MLLRPDPARADMPVADLPSTVLAVLGAGVAGGGGLGAALGWGTEEPPPPVQALLAAMGDARAVVTRAAAEVQTAAGPGGGPGGGSSFDEALAAAWASGPRDARLRLSALASELVGLWRAVARASRDGKLLQSDRRSLAAAPALLLPTLGLPLDEPLAPAGRCLGPTAAGAPGAPAGPAGLAHFLVAARFMVDGSDPRWCLAQECAFLAPVLALKASLSSQQAAAAAAVSFLGWLPLAAPAARGGPSDAQAAAFSAALAAVAAGGGAATPSPTAARVALRRSVRGDPHTVPPQGVPCASPRLCGR